MAYTDTPSSSPRKLRIAIIGGGLAGASAAGALSRLPDVEVRLYERAPAVRESGAQIAVMVTAIKVLRRMLSPAAWDHLQQVLYRGDNTDGIHHRHWKTGEILATAVSPDTPRHMQEGRASRPLLHKTLMMDVPDGVVNYQSEIVRLEPRITLHGQKEVVLHFRNGQAKIADLVIAADGLYSVRSQIHISALLLTDSDRKFGDNMSQEQISSTKVLLHTGSTFRLNESRISRTYPTTPLHSERGRTSSLYLA